MVQPVEQPKAKGNIFAKLGVTAIGAAGSAKLAEAAVSKYATGKEVAQKVNEAVLKNVDLKANKALFNKIRETVEKVKLNDMTKGQKGAVAAGTLLATAAVYKGVSSILDKRAQKKEAKTFAARIEEERLQTQGQENIR